MKRWKKMTAAVLGCVMTGALVAPAFAQGETETETVSAAGRENSGEQAAGADTQAEGADTLTGRGEDAIADESTMPQQGAGFGASIPDLRSQGDGADSDTDTSILEDIQLTFQVQGPYVLQDAEDEYFYYIYPWGSEGIPDIIVGAFNWNTTDGFFDQYSAYMQQARPDLTVAEAPAQEMIGGKNLQRIVYNYGIQGYNIQDTRYIWLGPNNVLYMFAKREIPDIGYTLGNTLESIIASSAVCGMTDTGSVPQTTASQGTPDAGTTTPQGTPDAGTTTPQGTPGAETTTPQGTSDAGTTTPQDTTQPAPAPSSTGSLYVQNADSSWTVTTSYYTMIIPPAWTGHFDASVTQGYSGGYHLKVVNKESADAGFGGHLFTVMLIPEGEDYSYLPSYDYLGTMAGPDGTFHVVIEYPTDLQTGDVWSEFYKILYGDKNSAITSMRPAAGVVWTLPDGRTVS